MASPISPPRPSTSSTNAHSEAPSDVQIPDGGLRAWLVVLGGFLDLTTAFGIMNSFGIFQAYYMNVILGGSNAATVSWIGSVQLFLLFLGGLVVGPAFDKWGARRIMIPGAVVCIVSYICTSFARRYYQILLSQGFLFGIRNAMLYYPAAGAISEWFDKRRGLALGVAISGSSMGGIFWPLVIDRLLDVVGFAWTNRALGLISLPILFIACVLVEERRDVRGHDAHGHELEVRPSIRKEIFDRHFMILCMALFFIFSGMLVPFYFIPLYAINCDIEETDANQLLAIGYAGSVMGRIGVGWIADRYGRFNVLIIMGTINSILIFSWMAMTSYATQIAFSVLFGFTSGGLVPLGSACVAQTANDLGHIGLRIGAMMAFCSTGTLVGGPIGGALKDGHGGWPAVFSFSGGSVLTGVLFLIWARFAWEPRLKVRV